jgi:hypothetical protein
LEDSQALTGGQTHAPVTWRGSGDLSSVHGKPVGIRVRMHRAKLFSVTMYGVDESLVRQDPRCPV